MPVEMKAIHVSKAKVLGANSGKRVFEAFKKNEPAQLLDLIKEAKDSTKGIKINVYEINGRLAFVKSKDGEIGLTGNYAAEDFGGEVKKIKEKTPVLRVDIALPKRATSLAGRIAYTIAGAASLIPFAAAVDMLILVSSTFEKQPVNTRQLFSSIIGVTVGIIVSGKLLHMLSNHLSKARNEFFQKVADVFETAVMAVGKKSPPRQEPI